MSRDQRMRDNWALLHALEEAGKRGAPVAVCFNLVRPKPRPRNACRLAPACRSRMHSLSTRGAPPCCHAAATHATPCKASPCAMRAPARPPTNPPPPHPS